MNEKELNLDVGPDGVIKSIYSDKLNDLAEKIGGDLVQVCRLSHVEWEEVGNEKGWTVRSAHDPELAIRWILQRSTVSTNPAFPIAVFSSRQDALFAEKAHVDELMPPKEKR